MVIEVQKKYTVVVENYDGECKRVKVYAFTPAEAMAKAHNGGWFPVQVL
jgi:hypothetical protein